MKILFAYKNSESLGIEYISSVLKKEGHKTDLMFDPGAGEVELKINIISRLFKFEKDLIFKIKKFSPDLIAFSSMTNLFPWVRDLTKKIKEQFEIPIVVGGLHPTIIPEETLRYKYIDMICRGEGEYAMLDLVNSLESKKENYKIDNIWFIINNKIIKNPIRPLIENLDDLPFPDKDLFFKYGAFSKRYYIMTSRGCPFSCSYCHNHQIKELYKNFKKFVRFRSVDNVINELKWALNRYKFKKIYFYDDIFGLNNKWLKEFTIKYKKEIKKPYKCLIRPQSLSKEKLSLLKKSNCQEIDVGLESGNDRIRNKILKRHITDKEMIKNLFLLKNSGIKISTLNIIGSPTETMEELMDTFKMNYIIRPKGALFHILYPFPKTQIFEICKEIGLLDEKKIELLNQGELGYRISPILPNNYGNIVKFNIFAPIFLKLPKCFRKYMFKLPPLNFFRTLSVFFLTTQRNLRLKLYEFFYMLIKTSDYYSKLKKI